MRLTLALLLVVLTSLPAFAANDKGNITFEIKNAGSVLFSHDHHTKARGVKCSACHFQTFSEGKESFRMKRDKLTKRDFCEHCHNGLKGFDARSEKNCSRCHNS